MPFPFLNCSSSKLLKMWHGTSTLSPFLLWEEAAIKIAVRVLLIGVFNRRSVCRMLVTVATTQGLGRARGCLVMVADWKQRMTTGLTARRGRRPEAAPGLLRSRHLGGSRWVRTFCLETQATDAKGDCDPEKNARKWKGNQVQKPEDDFFNDKRVKIL